MFNLAISSIKALESLIENIENETLDPIEKSIKNVRKNFKAGNYLAIASLFLLVGLSSILSQYFTGHYFLQSLVYFSFAFLSILIFIVIVWRILK